MYFDSPHAFYISSQRSSHCRLFDLPNKTICRSQWPRDLRCGSAAARLLRLWVRIPPAVWMFLCCECRVLSGRVLCHKLITLPEESCRCVWSRNLVNEEDLARWGFRAKNKQYHSAKAKVTNLLCYLSCCHIFLLGLNILVRALFSKTLCLWPPRKNYSWKHFDCKRSNFLSGDVFSSGFVNKISIKF